LKRHARRGIWRYSGSGCSLLCIFLITHSSNLLVRINAVNNAMGKSLFTAGQSHFKAAVVLRVALIIISVGLLGTVAHAQKNDLGVTFGGYFTADNPLSAGTAFAIEGSYARRIFAVPALQFSVELPVAGSFDSFAPSSFIPVIGNSYTALFITPGVRARLAPSFFLSPYFAVGAGLAHFNNSLTGGGSSSNNSFAADFGGGLDLRIFPHVSLRAEVRDFYSGSPGLNPLFLQRQNNLVVTGGVGIRF